MARMLIATPRLSDGGAVTSSGTLASAMPVTNLQTQQPSQRARWTALTGIEITLDLLAGRAIDFIFLGSHNASDDATWRVRAADQQADLTTAPGYDSGVVSMFATVEPLPPSFPGAFRSSLLWLGGPEVGGSGPGAQTFRHWRLDVSDGGNPDGWFEAGRLALDQAWQPSANLQFGWLLGFDDGSLVERTAGGQSHPLEQGRPRQVEFFLSFLDEDEMYENAYELDRRRGRARDVIFVRDPAATKHLLRQTLHGLMSELAPIVHARPRLFEKRFRIVELL